MVQVYFDLYGPDFGTLSKCHIRDHHVTQVGFVYAFYVAKVGNPSVDTDQHSSTRRRIYCDECEWEMFFNRSSGGRGNGCTKRDKAMFGPWQLSKLPAPHLDCTSSKTIFIRKSIFIIHHRPFVDAMIKNPHITFAEARNLWNDPYQLTSSKCLTATFSRAKQAVQVSMVQDRNVGYNNLASFLFHLRNENPDLTLALQLDSEKRFYRVFIGFPQSTMYHGQISYSFMQTDGFHFKGHAYDGVIILYCTKTGFSRNIILGFAIVPRESTEHHCWSLQMLWRCHPSMTIPQVLFTDRGHLLNAVRSIHDQMGILVPINYCDRHFIRNIVSQFKIKKEHRHIISNGIRQCAASQTIDQFLASVEHFASSLLTLSDSSSNALLTSRILLYILKVHPRFWTVFANRKKFDLQSWDFQLNQLLTTFLTVQVLAKVSATTLNSFLHGEPSVVSELSERILLLRNKHLDEMKSGPPIPPPLPRFNTYTTNLVEGEALCALNNSSRFGDIYNAIYGFCSAVNTGIDYTRQACSRILQTNPKAKYTGVGCKVSWWYQNSSPVDLKEIHSTRNRLEVIALVKSASGQPHNVKVAFSKAKARFLFLCDNCCLSEMVESPCACALIAFKAAMERKIFPAFDKRYWYRLMYHPAHILEYTTKALPDMSPIIIPSHGSTLSNINASSFQCTHEDGSISNWDGVVNPPPTY